MVVLLSVGEAMVDQSRDVSLVGGGEITVLPQGIDVEAMRTGGLGGMFFAIDRARFLTRQVIGGPRHAALVRTVAPAIEGKLLYLCRAGAECRPDGGPRRRRDPESGRRARRRARRAPGRVARLARRLGLRRADPPAALRRARPVPSSPAAGQHLGRVALLQRDHRPRRVVVRHLPRRRRGEPRARGRHAPLGRTHARDPPPAGRRATTASRPTPPPRRSASTPRGRISSIGPSTVRQRDGVYHLDARAAGTRGRGASGARAAAAGQPILSRRSSSGTTSSSRATSCPAWPPPRPGRSASAGRCAGVADVPAYHDHNWGVWRDVTWEWGAARGGTLSLLYGGVYGPERGRDGPAGAVTSPFFLTLVDSLGVRQVLRFGRVAYEGRAAGRRRRRARPRPGASRWWRPAARTA